MSASGAQHVAFVKPTGFLSIPADPDYYSPGRNITVDELSLSRQLAELREPDNAEAIETIAGYADGAFAASWAMNADTHRDVQDIVFNDLGVQPNPNEAFNTGQAALSRWYVGTDYFDDTNSVQTQERVLKGCIPLSYSISYQQSSNTIRESLTMAYADEEANTVQTPISTIGATQDSTVPFHGADLQINATGVNNRLQSATLEFGGPMYRYQTGTDPIPVNAVTAGITKSLTMAASFEREQHRELAYGGTGATTLQDTVDSVSGSLQLSAAGGTVATYGLPNMAVNNYSWNDLITPDTDLAENVEFTVTGDLVIS
jgi:hypothetical protein